jgi:3-dehydroquinate synthase
LHGEAVAIGILMALNLSQRKGLIKADLEMQYRQLLEILNLPTSIKPELGANEFLSVMKKDKKNQTSAYRLVLVEGDEASCHCILQEENDQRLIRSVLQHFGIAV